MSAFIRSKFILPLVSALAVFALSAHAEDAPTPAQPAQTPADATQKPAAKAAVQTQKPGPGRSGQGAGRGPKDGRVARGALPARNYGGQPYRGRVAWEGGRWHHEVRDGRDGWWCDVGGPYGPPVVGAYPPPPGAYAPPPPPPPPDPAASAVGGAIVGGLLGGLLTGRASGAAVGAVAGGATGAIVGATAASQPGYYLAQGNCYYRYPSGQYVLADPRACY